MVFWLFCALVLLGLVLVSVMVLAARRQLAQACPAAPEVWPAVSVLKPLKGVDAGLEENLASFFRLDYPYYEVLLGAEDPADPALEVARRVAAAHPDVPSRVFAERRRVGFNPKVNNLANLARHMRHDVVWISDSNTRVEGATLKGLAAHLCRPGVGLVSSPFRGVGAKGLGGACESLQLNTFVLGGVAAAHRVVRRVCVVGKSMLLPRVVLDQLGGFTFLARFLAEDQVCGEEVAAQGREVVVGGGLIDNMLGRQTLRSFLARHLRWAKIRRRMAPAGYLGEALLNPVFLALCGALAWRTTASLGVLAAALLAKSVLDAAADRFAGVRRPPASYLGLTLLKDVLVGATWIVPFFAGTVRWRGTRLRVGRRTLLVPADGAQPQGLAPVSAPTAS
jgi:ceramide glucosyltransferase